jgi:ABC-type transport system substrate-binding protein
LFAVLAVFAMLVAACTPDGATDTTAGEGDGATTEAPDTTAGEGDGDGAAAPEGSFRVGFISNITTDNWWASLDTLASTYNQGYLTNMHTSLFTLSLPGFVYVPAMAATDEPVAAVQEGDVWVVEQPIKEGVTWSDGTPVTANDLAFYFDTVREFNLGSNHSAAFPPSVLNITAPDDYTVRIEFDAEPGLAVWQNGVGFADFVPAHFWQEHVDAARAAAEEATAGVTEEDARQGVADALAEDEDPENDKAAADVTQEEIDAYIADAGASEGLTVLYAVEAPQEPSVGAVIFDQWETGAFAATVANTDYPDSGTENTYFSDGSFRIAKEGEEPKVFGGEGTGDVVAQYVEGPFVGEILWVEHGTKDAAYEKLSAGELDYVWDPTGLTSGLRNELATNQELAFSVNQTEGFRYMAFNMRKPPMSDLAFRQATATVINKELVADTVLANAVFPGYTVVHPDLAFWYNDEVPRAGWADGEPMDEGTRMETAIQILKDAGYSWETEPVVLRGDDGTFLDVTPGAGLIMPNGESVPNLTLLAPGPGYDPFRATFAIWISQWMKDLGIPIEAEPTDFNAISAAVFPPQTEETALAWDIYMLGWGGGDPSLPGTSSVAFFHSREDALTGGGFNTPGFNNADFDAAADAFEAATTPEQAQQWTFEMERILAEQLPYVVLFRTPIIEAFRADVQFPAQTIMGGHSGFPNAWPSAVEVTE